jgi:hypothetical protein
MDQIQVTDNRKWNFTIIDNDFIMDGRLSPAEKAVFITLCMFSNAEKDKPVYPSISTLCEYTGMSKPTVINAIRGLEDKHYIEIEEQHNSNKGKTANKYKILSIESRYDGGKNSLLGGLKNFTRGGKNSLLGVVKNFDSNENNSKQEQSKTRNTDTNVSGVNSLFDLESLKKDTPVDTKKMTRSELAMYHIEQARAGRMSWNDVTDRDFTYYFMSAHENVLGTSVTFDRYSSISIIRDNLIKRYDLPRERVCEYIDEILRLYKNDPERWDTLSFGCIQKNDRLLKRLVLEAKRKLDPEKSEKQKSPKSENVKRETF